MQYLNFQTACSQAYSQNKSQQTIQHRLNKQESALKSKIDDLLAEGDENSGRDCLNIQKYEQANNVTIQNNIDLLDNSDDECSQQSLKLEEGKQRFETQPDIDQSLSSISNTFCSPKVNTFDGQNMQLLSFDKRGLQNSSESHCKNGMASLKFVKLRRYWKNSTSSKEEEICQFTTARVYRFRKSGKKDIGFSLSGRYIKRTTFSFNFQIQPKSPTKAIQRVIVLASKIKFTFTQEKVLINVLIIKGIKDNNQEL
eukprot:403370976